MGRKGPVSKDVPRDVYDEHHTPIYVRFSFNRTLPAKSPTPPFNQIRYMKPLLDDKFVAYMGYAIQTEREAIEKRGLNPDREPSRWLQVLGVIQKGVMAELQKSVHQDVEVRRSTDAAICVCPIYVAMSSLILYLCVFCHDRDVLGSFGCFVNGARYWFQNYVSGLVP